ncbi:hypothetical protein B0J17DRAFT_660656 [Rhizoctonia solani]|nr:hypothetical protein B0J17DRAFT_660656 [Rhizoctonia solani]
MTERDSASSKSRAVRWVLVNESPDIKSNDNPSQIETSQPLKRHPEFFFDNTLVAIQIEDTLFNVHKYQLSKSAPEGSAPHEGSSPEHPLKLECVTASDFAALLRVLYASHFSNNPPTPEASLVVPAFRLANMFDFAELRAFLLPLAEESLDDVDKIIFAREFDIKEWIAPAHVRLCKREAVLNDEEASKLGVKSVLMIWRMREQHRSRSNIATTNTLYCKDCAGWQSYGNTTGTCPHCHFYGHKDFVRYMGPGTMGGTTNTNDTTLEAEVKKWVEDGYAARVK